MNKLHLENIARVTRRQLFGSAASGVGLAALASLLGPPSARGEGGSVAVPRGDAGLPGLPHHAPKAKRVVVLWQGGGPSHVDLFDPKPLMRNDGGQRHPCNRAGDDSFINDVERLRKMADRAGDQAVQKVRAIRDRDERDASQCWGDGR